MYLAGVAVECKLGVYGPVDVSLLFAVTDIQAGKLSTTRGPNYDERKNQNKIGLKRDWSEVKI